MLTVERSEELQCDGVVLSDVLPPMVGKRARSESWPAAEAWRCVVIRARAPNLLLQARHAGEQMIAKPHHTQSALSYMEESERPTKLRKIGHDDAVPSNGAKLAEVIRAEPEPQGHTQDRLPALQANLNGTDEVDDPSVDSCTAPNVDAGARAPPDSTTTDCTKISKSQLKKQRKQAEWEAGRADRKLLRKEKAGAKKERKKAAREAAIANGTYVEPTSNLPAARPIQLPITIVFDCNFDDLMTDGERMSLGAQLTRAYSDNRKAPYRAHLAVSSFGGKLRERFDGRLNKMHENWQGVHFLEADFVDTATQAQTWMHTPKHPLPGGAFKKYQDDFESNPASLISQGETVYLTSEAEDTLTELKPFSTYIVGGLVDRNREKGICFKRATARGMRTARLPIGSYLDMQSRQVLATNHVNEIILRWLELGDWGEAFMKVIPKRKGGKLKHNADADKQTEEDDNSEDAAAG